MDGKVIATAKEKPWKLGTQYEIFGEDGGHFATFEHECMESFKSFKSKYSIKDTDGVPRLYTEQMDFWSTEFNILDGHKNLICALKRPAMSWRYQWKVNIIGDIDRRIAAFMPTFLAAEQKKRDRRRRNANS